MYLTDIFAWFFHVKRTFCFSWNAKYESLPYSTKFDNILSLLSCLIVRDIHWRRWVRKIFFMYLLYELKCVFLWRGAIDLMPFLLHHCTVHQIIWYTLDSYGMISVEYYCEGYLFVVLSFFGVLSWEVIKGGGGVEWVLSVGSGSEYFLGNMVVCLVCYLCMTKWFIMFDVDGKIWYLY